MSTTTEDSESQPESLVQRLLRTGELSDCSFVVGEGEQTETFHCHKFPLCKSSEVFQVMFLGELKEKAEVKVTDIAPDVFKILLQYIYTDEVKFDDLDMSLEVLMAANKYLISSLVEKCLNFIIDNMQAGDVCKMLEVANLIDNQQLKQACIKVLQEKAEEVLSAPSWVDAPATSVLTFVQQDALNLNSEMYLLAACERWAQHQGADDKLVENLAQMKPHLRVRTLNTEQFVKATKESCIFSEYEFSQILCCIVKPELNLPAGLCELTTPRVVPDHIDKIDIAAINTYMSNKYNNSNLNLIISSARYTTQFPALVLYAVRCHILVYGVGYIPISQDSVDILYRISSQEKYEEDMTVQLIDKQTRACVACLHCKQKMGYNGYARELLFPQPCLMKSGTQLELKVTYHNIRFRGKRSFYVGATTFNNITATTNPMLYAEKNTEASGINFVIYKVVK